jgi:hypothetical protein
LIESTGTDHRNHSSLTDLRSALSHHPFTNKEETTEILVRLLALKPSPVRKSMELTPRFTVLPTQWLIE